VSANLTGDLMGTIVLAVSAGMVDAVERGPVAPQELVPALEPAIRDATTMLASSLGIDVMVDSPIEVGADVAFSGAELLPFTAVTLHDGETHVASLAVILAEPETGVDEPGGAGGVGEMPGATVTTPQPPSAGVEPLTAPSAQAGTTTGMAPSPIEILSEVEMGVTAELGRTRMTVRELLGLVPGSIVELDRAAGSPIDVLVNGTLVARGEVVVVDEEFGVRIVEIVGSNADILR
jgi:flagellar motor switch protein FliN/FliY